jgi:hypothetical protein
MRHHELTGNSPKNPKVFDYAVIEQGGKIAERTAGVDPFRKFANVRTWTPPLCQAFSS